MKLLCYKKITSNLPKHLNDDINSSTQDHVKFWKCNVSCLKLRSKVTKTRGGAAMLSEHQVQGHGHRRRADVLSLLLLSWNSSISPLSRVGSAEKTQHNSGDKGIEKGVKFRNEKDLAGRRGRRAELCPHWRTSSRFGYIWSVIQIQATFNQKSNGHRVIFDLDCQSEALSKTKKDTNGYKYKRENVREYKNWL